MIYGERWNRVAEADNLVSEKDGLPLSQSIFKKRKALIISNEKSCRERGRLVYLSVGGNFIWTHPNDFLHLLKFI